MIKFFRYAFPIVLFRIQNKNNQKLTEFFHFRKEFPTFPIATHKGSENNGKYISTEQLDIKFVFYSRLHFALFNGDDTNFPSKRRVEIPSFFVENR